MMLQIGDEGIVSSVDEENLIYVDKNELEQFIESYQELEKENEQLKKSNQKLNDELQETMGYLALKSGVEKENDQLKQQIKDLYRFVKCDIDNEIDVYPKSILEHLVNILKMIGDVE